MDIPQTAAPARKDITSTADIEAIERAGLPELPASTYEMIRQSAAMDPEGPALSFFLTADELHKPETWSYREFLAQITRTANFLHRIGVKKDTVVAYVLPNLPETHFVIWGGQSAGIVAALNPLLEGEALAQLLKAAKAQVLITLAPFPGTDLWSKLQPHLGSIGSLRHLVLVDLPSRVRGLKHYVARLMQARETWRLHGSSGLQGAMPASITLHHFSQAIAGENPDRLDSKRVFDPDDTSSFFCTGGTTGLPKIAMRTHRNEVFDAWSAGEFIGDDIAPRTVVYCGLPLFHVNAVMATGLLPFSKGAHVVLGTPQGYRGEGVVKRFWEIVEHYGINFFSGVPTLYSALLQVPIDGRKLDSLHYGLCGAAPMSREVFRNFQQQTGLKILEGYGLTEATCISSINPPRGERRIGSIGLRLPFQDMKSVVLADSGAYMRDCATDEVGTLIVSGPNVFLGYRIAEQNRDIWVDCGDGKRWLNTGDLARQDADGYFWLVGRKKELIIRGGHNIDPLVIEEPLYRHPAVELAAAIGRPDEYAGELPVVYVQLKSGTSATEDELLTWLTAQIGERAAVPKQVHIIKTMPLTSVGKIFKPELKNREIGDALAQALHNAGIKIRSIEAVSDGQKGVIVNLQLEPEASAEAARQVLRRYPFFFQLG